MPETLSLLNQNGKGAVLAVEDERTSLKLLISVLTAEGYHVEAADCGESALAAIANNPPELILLDVNLPGVDGFEVCRRLKANEKTAHIPIIFISATSETKERVEGFKLGAVDFVSKPFQRDELLARVETHMALARLRAALTRKAADLRQANDQLQNEIACRREIASALAESEEKLNLALEAAQMGIWELDTATGHVWRSRLHDQIFGYDTLQPQWDQERLFAHVIADDRERVRRYLAGPSEDGAIRFECRIVRASDQTQRWIHLQGQAHCDGEGVPLRIMGVIVDITEHKLAEQERRAIEEQSSLSQKLESVGRLASGVAHEINTPVQFINDNMLFLKRSLDSLNEVLVAHRELAAAAAAGRELAPHLQRIVATEETNELEYLMAEIPRTFDETMGGLQRVTQIVKSLKKFSHPNKTSKQPADLNDGILTTIAVSRHEWKYVADLTAELDPDLPLIPLVIDEINQVVLNLIVNAAHAIADALPRRGEAKGLITIRTKRLADRVRIDVQDNGTGIPESAQPHIFEPFFTTKGVGKGTGQGLTIVHSIIVKNHGGTIDFTTEPGKGTAFHITLPLVPEPAAIPA